MLSPAVTVGLPTAYGKETACHCRRPGFDPWVGKIPGKGHGNPLQHSCLENYMDRGYSPWVHKESDMIEQLTHSPLLTSDLEWSIETCASGIFPQTLAICCQYCNNSSNIILSSKNPVICVSLYRFCSESLENLTGPKSTTNWMISNKSLPLWTSVALATEQGDLMRTVVFL